MTRSSSHNISASIAKIAVQDLLDSGEENDMDMDEDADITLVKSDGEDEDEDKEQDSGTGGESGKEESEDSDSNKEDSEDSDGSDKEESEDSDDSNNSSDGDDAVVIPQKRKRSGSSKKSNEPSPRDIEYKISIFSAKEMKKSKSSRRPVTEAVVLKSNVPWATLKTTLLTEINNALDPSSLNFHDYIITFTVPRQVSDPMQLSNDTKYKYLVGKALQIQKNPSAKVLIEQKGSLTNKENNMNEDEDDTTEKQAKKKSKIPKACDILPANVALNEKIGELRQRWICPTPGGPCGSAHCYFNNINPEHMPLSHDHFQSWGAAMHQLKGITFADLETPPSNDLFDKVSQGARVVKSPLLQRRLELRQETATKQASPAPQVHLNFGAELANLFRPAAAPPAPPPAAPNAFIPPPNSSNMLIPFPCLPGPDLSIEDFCTLYNLDADICD
ncbi:hypothetical protein DFH07DRAFT_992852 [Mycena maculata]|uniref:Uncharacterized protein n=1 Tax=Mycena maculata TaxID=230809 RepID=A0AAD7HZ43_9AGAR|nr:hypothetical protein DFH07DRAFT_992852 [Mycena maculata]